MARSARHPETSNFFPTPVPCLDPLLDLDDLVSINVRPYDLSEGPRIPCAREPDGDELQSALFDFQSEETERLAYRLTVDSRANNYHSTHMERRARR